MASLLQGITYGNPYGPSLLTRMGLSSTREILTVASLDDRKSSKLPVDFSLFQIADNDTRYPGSLLMELNIPEQHSIHSLDVLLAGDHGKPSDREYQLRLNMVRSLNRRVKELCREYGLKVMKVISTYPRCQVIVEPTFTSTRELVAKLSAAPTAPSNPPEARA